MCIYVGSSDINVVLPFSPLGDDSSGVVIIVSSALALTPFSILVSILVSTSVVSVVDVVSAGIGAAAPFSRGIPCTGSFVNFTCKFCAIAVVTTENIEIIHINVQITRFIFTPLF